MKKILKVEVTSVQSIEVDVSDMNQGQIAALKAFYRASIENIPGASAWFSVVNVDGTPTKEHAVDTILRRIFRSEFGELNVADGAGEDVDKLPGD